MNIRICQFTCVLFVVCLAVLSFPSAMHAADVEQWGMWELSLDGPRDGNPYIDAHVTARARHSSRLDSTD